MDLSSRSDSPCVGTVANEFFCSGNGLENSRIHQDTHRGYYLLPSAVLMQLLFGKHGIRMAFIELKYML